METLMMAMRLFCVFFKISMQQKWLPCKQVIVSLIISRFLVALSAGPKCNDNAKGANGSYKTIVHATK